METGIIIAALSFLTLGIFLVLGRVSKRQTEKRMEDDNARKSRLAKDAPDR